MVKIIVLFRLFTDALIHMCVLRVIQVLEAHFPENKTILKNIGELKNLVDEFERRIGYSTKSKYTAQINKKHKERKKLLSGLVYYAKWLIRTSKKQG